ncbi:MAG: protein-signal peptide and transmembrane prediction [Gemmataceae bacterium]
MSHQYAPLIPAVLVALGVAVFAPAAEPASSLRLTLRSRPNPLTSSAGPATERTAEWGAKKTAIIVCDMWDQHWCKSAEARVGELVGPLEVLLKAARDKGVFVIHAPSTCTNFYKDTPQRKRAKDAPFAAAPQPLATTERWGTAWNWPDAKREAPLPIDDSDMGCDCKVKCTIREAWTRQHAAITIAPQDAITDNGQETWNLLAERKIDNVILCGVHLNMCVLGRPFAIRAMVKQGKTVALIRDLTDTMYNPERPPGGTHFDGTDRVVEHVERFWCPTFLSSDITGGRPFKFKDDPRK